MTDRLLFNDVATVSLTRITCGGCGGVYAIAERYRVEKYDLGGFWNCPYCRISWGYGKSENGRLKEQVQQEQARLARERAQHDQTKAALLTKEHERRAAVGLTTRLRNRVKAGVCIPCNRSFTDLRRHMESKHTEPRP